MKSRLVMTFAAGALATATMAGGVAAQDETADPGATALVEFADWRAPVLDATDPRASGDLTVESGAHFQAPGAFGLDSVSLRLVNEEGTWTGMGRHYVRGDKQDAVIIWEMTGGGGYDGLTLFMFPSDDRKTWGVIVPSGSIPPYPEVPVE